MEHSVTATNLDLSKLLFDASPDALFVVGEDGVILLANEQVERLFGYSKNEIQGKQLELLLPERFRAFHAQLRSGYDSNPRMRPMGVGRQLLGCRKDASEFPVDVGLSPIRKSDQSGGLLVLAAVRNVSEQKKFEQQRLDDARWRQQQQQELTDTICHELRSPLLGLFGGIALLKECLHALSSASAPTEALTTMREQLTMMEMCVQQQQVLVDDVLDLSRAEALNPEPRTEKVDINELLRAVRQLFLHQLRSRQQLALHFHVTPDPLLEYVDRKRLLQVLTNLIGNAIKFTHRGSVTVNVARESSSNSSTNLDQLRFSIEDTGIGMSSEEIAKLFQRFTQATPNIVALYGGSGLGLSISRRLVEHMGGAMTVQSEKGRGTVVCFTIAIRHPQQWAVGERAGASAPLASSAQVPPRHTLNVLIVDDSIINQRVLSKYIERAGHVSFLASNGEEAVKMCSSMTFDMIFMDIEMPIMGGYEATRKIRDEEHPLPLQRRTPIVGISGNARQQYIDDALRAGMDDYITKPFHELQLRQVIERYAGHNQ